MDGFFRTIGSKLGITGGQQAVVDDEEVRRLQEEQQRQTLLDQARQQFEAAKQAAQQQADLVRQRTEQARGWFDQAKQAAAQQAPAVQQGMAQGLDQALSQSAPVQAIRAVRAAPQAIATAQASQASQAQGQGLLGDTGLGQAYRGVTQGLTTENVEAAMRPGGPVEEAVRRGPVGALTGGRVSLTAPRGTPLGELQERSTQGVMETARGITGLPRMAERVGGMIHAAETGRVGQEHTGSILPGQAGGWEAKPGEAQGQLDLGQRAGMAAGALIHGVPLALSATANPLYNVVPAVIKQGLVAAGVDDETSDMLGNIAGFFTKEGGIEHAGKMLPGSLGRLGVRLQGMEEAERLAAELLTNVQRAKIAVGTGAGAAFGAAQGFGTAREEGLSPQDTLKRMLSGAADISEMGAAAGVRGAGHARGGIGEDRAVIGEDGAVRPPDGRAPTRPRTPDERDPSLPPLGVTTGTGQMTASEPVGRPDLAAAGRPSLEPGFVAPGQALGQGDAGERTFRQITTSLEGAQDEVDLAAVMRDVTEAMTTGDLSRDQAATLRTAVRERLGVRSVGDGVTDLRPQGEQPTALDITPGRERLSAREPGGLAQQGQVDALAEPRFRTPPSEDGRDGAVAAQQLPEPEPEGAAATAESLALMRDGTREQGDAYGALMGQLRRAAELGDAWTLRSQAGHILRLGPEAVTPAQRAYLSRTVDQAMQEAGAGRVVGPQRAGEPLPQGQAERDTAEPEVMRPEFAGRPAPGTEPRAGVWFSQLERVLEAKFRQPRMQAAQVRQLLLGNGVKKEELFWTGVGDYLDQAERERRPVERQALMDWAQQGRLPLSETVLGYLQTGGDPASAQRARENVARQLERAQQVGADPETRASVEAAIGPLVDSVSGPLRSEEDRRFRTEVFDRLLTPPSADPEGNRLEGPEDVARAWLDHMRDIEDTLVVASSLSRRNPRLGEMGLGNNAVDPTVRQDTRQTVRDALQPVRRRVETAVTAAQHINEQYRAGKEGPPEHNYYSRAGESNYTLRRGGEKSANPREALLRIGTPGRPAPQMSSTTGTPEENLASYEQDEAQRREVGPLQRQIRDVGRFAVGAHFGGREGIVGSDRTHDDTLEDGTTTVHSNEQQSDIQQRGRKSGTYDLVEQTRRANDPVDPTIKSQAEHFARVYEEALDAEFASQREAEATNDYGGHRGAHAWAFRTMRARKRIRSREQALIQSAVPGEDVQATIREEYATPGSSLNRLRNEASGEPPPDMDATPAAKAYARASLAMMEAEDAYHEGAFDQSQTARAERYRALAEVWTAREQALQADYDAGRRTSPDDVERFRVISGHAANARDEVERLSAPQGDEMYPRAPFPDNTIIEKLIERQIRDAADRGAGAMSWSTGQVIARRWSAGRIADEVRYSPESKGLTVVPRGADANDRGRSRTYWDTPPEKVADYVGAEAARFLTDPANLGEDGQAILSGQDILALDQKGQTMVQQYDRAMVSAANKIAKKYGAQVERTRLQPPPGHDPSEDPDLDVWALKLNDALRQGVQQGFPLFQRMELPEDRANAQGSRAEAQTNEADVTGEATAPDGTDDVDAWADREGGPEEAQGAEGAERPVEPTPEETAAAAEAEPEAEEGDPEYARIVAQARAAGLSGAALDEEVARQMGVGDLRVVGREDDGTVRVRPAKRDPRAHWSAKTQGPRWQMEALPAGETGEAGTKYGTDIPRAGRFAHIGKPGRAPRFPEPEGGWPVESVSAATAAKLGIEPGTKVRLLPPEPGDAITGGDFLYWNRVSKGEQALPDVETLTPGRYRWSPENAPPQGGWAPGTLDRSMLPKVDYDAELDRVGFNWGSGTRAVDRAKLRDALRRYDEDDLAVPRAAEEAGVNKATLQRAVDTLGAPLKKSGSEGGAIKAERDNTSEKAWTYTDKKGGGEEHAYDSLYEVLMAIKLDNDDRVASWSKVLGKRARVRFIIDPERAYHPLDKPAGILDAGREGIFVPDFLVTYDDGTQEVIEVKHAAAWTLDPWKVQEKVKAAREHYAQWGVGFRLFAEDQIGRRFGQDVGNGEYDLSGLSAADRARIGQEAFKVMRQREAVSLNEAGARGIIEFNRQTGLGRTVADPMDALDDALPQAAEQSTAHTADQGSSFWPTPEARPAYADNAWMVSLFPARGQRIDGGDGTVSDLRLAQFRIENQDLLTAFPEMAVGTWLDTDPRGVHHVYLDLSLPVPAEQDALELAALMGEKAIWHTGEKRALTTKASLRRGRATPAALRANEARIARGEPPRRLIPNLEDQKRAVKEALGRAAAAGGDAGGTPGLGAVEGATTPEPGATPGAGLDERGAPNPGAPAGAGLADDGGRGAGAGPAGAGEAGDALPGAPGIAGSPLGAPGGRGRAGPGEEPGVPAPGALDTTEPGLGHPGEPDSRGGPAPARAPAGYEGPNPTGPVGQQLAAVGLAPAEAGVATTKIGGFPGEQPDLPGVRRVNQDMDQAPAVGATGLRWVVPVTHDRKGMAGIQRVRNGSAANLLSAQARANHGRLADAWGQAFQTVQQGMLGKLGPGGDRRLENATAYGLWTQGDIQAVNVPSDDPATPKRIAANPHSTLVAALADLTGPKGPSLAGFQTVADWKRAVASAFATKFSEDIVHELTHNEIEHNEHDRDPYWTERLRTNVNTSATYTRATTKQLLAMLEENDFELLDQLTSEAAHLHDAGVHGGPRWAVRDPLFAYDSVLKRVGGDATPGLARWTGPGRTGRAGATPGGPAPGPTPGGAIGDGAGGRPGGPGLGRGVGSAIDAGGPAAGGPRPTGPGGALGGPGDGAGRGAGPAGGVRPGLGEPPGLGDRAAGLRGGGPGRAETGLNGTGRDGTDGRGAFGGNRPGVAFRAVAPPLGGAPAAGGPGGAPPAGAGASAGGPAGPAGSAAPGGGPGKSGAAAATPTAPGKLATLGSGAKLSMLLSPKGALRQLLGNIGTVGWQPVERAVAGGIAGAVDRSGRADVPDASEALAMVGAYRRNLRGAFREMRNSLSATAPVNPSSAALGASPAGRPMPTGPHGVFARGIDQGFRILGVFDEGARYLAGVAEQAALDQRNARRGAQGKATLTPAEVAERVESVKAYRTLTQDMDDHFSKGVAEFRKGAVGKVLIPFWDIPYNGLKYDLERSPLGFGKVALDTALNKGDIRTKLDRTELYERWARGTLGSALAAGLVLAYTAGKLPATGPEPDDDEEAKQWKAEGKTPFSLQIGGRWVPLTQIPGLNATLTQVATVGDYLQRHDAEGRGWDPAEYYRLVNRLVTTTAQYSVSRPFFEGVSEVLQAGSSQARGRDDTGVLDVLTKQATGAIPAVRLLREAEQATSDVDLAPRDQTERVLAGIPGLSGSVPVRRDAYGRVQTRTGSGLERFLNPLPGRDAQTSPARYQGVGSAAEETAMAEAVKAVKAEADAKAKGVRLPASALPTQTQRNLARRARENPRYAEAKAKEKTRLEKERAGTPATLPSAAARLVGAR